MLQEITSSVRRWTGLGSREREPLVRAGDVPHSTVDQAHNDLETLRGVTLAAADQTPCTCPDACERDHANE